MKLMFNYYCPTCETEKTVEGSEAYHRARGFVHCVCHTVVNVKQKAKRIWNSKGEIKISGEEFQCEACGKALPHWKPQFCCNAFDCGCGGKPLYPPICSNKCYDKLKEKENG